MVIAISLSVQERNIMLCALRLLQEELHAHPKRFGYDDRLGYTVLGDLLTHGGLEPISDSIGAIHDLCHRLNHA